MKRVYRLLRNNTESGPFTIDELLGQQLKSSDMLWIEGRSKAWAYLSEIELTPSIESADFTPIHHATEQEELEERAEAVRKRVMLFKQQSLPVIEEKGEQGEMHYYIPTPNEEVIELVDHRKQKSTIVHDVMMTAVISCMVAGGLYGGKALFFSANQTTKPEIFQTVSSDHHAAKAVAVENVGSVSNSSVDSLVKETVDSTALFAKRQIPDSTTIVRRRTKIELQPTEAVANIATPNQTNQPPAGVKDTNEKKEDAVAVKEVKPITISSNHEAKEEDVVKKPGIFKKLFGKKKKEDKEALDSN